MFQKKRKNSIFTDYTKSLDQKDYERALDYCTCFSRDEEAEICRLYVQYRRADTAPEDLKDKIWRIYQRVNAREHRKYDENVLYCLGELLFECELEAEGDGILRSIASLEKRNDNFKEFEKKARDYLDKHYLKKWEDRHQIDDLEKAAKSLAYSRTCYLYARKLREKADELRKTGRNQDIEKANSYDNIAYDYKKHYAKYCVVLMDEATDIEEEIKGHMKIMCQEIRALPEAVRNTIHLEFEPFRTQMSELSEQMERREEIVCSLVEKAETLDLELQGNRDTLQEIKDLAEQISVADQDREERLMWSIDGIKNAILESDNRLLQKIVDEAKAEIDSRFQDRLSPKARDSIVTALFTLNFYRELNKEHEPLVEYSGVAILAASALEIELNQRLYEPFGEYVQKVDNKSLRELLRKGKNYYFTLGSFQYVVGIHCKELELYKMFSEFIKNDSRFSTNPGSLFQYKADAQLRRDLLEKFSNRLSDLNEIRKNAAHINTVTLKNAEKACQLSFLSPQKRAIATTEESIALLEWLLDSCK